MFLVRRIVYALAIVFMAQYAVFSIFLVMLSGMIMLAYALSEWQWKDHIISCQHIGDEVTIYVLCVLLLLYSGFVES